MKHGTVRDWNWISGAVISALAAILGWLFFFCHMGAGVTNLSYDLPFATRSDIRENEAALVYLDDVSHAELGQPFGSWDRKLHVRLIDKLTAQGAKAILFDILFAGPSGDATTDQQLADAIRASHRVILAGQLGKAETRPGVGEWWPEYPFKPFLDGAVGCGTVNLLPGSDGGIRVFFPNVKEPSGQSDMVSMPWAAAQFVGATVTKDVSPPPVVRWLNYYGPPGSLPGVSYSKALAPDGVPPDFFKNKVVFIGERASADFGGKGPDEFATPYTKGHKGYMPGVEIHATAFLNLLRGEWLVRMPFTAELLLVLAVAGLAGFGLVRLHPLAATGAALAGMVVITLFAHILVWHGQVWFAWIVLLMEVGFALFCSVIYNSLKLYVEKRLLEQSLGYHLSPAVVRRLLKDPNMRKPGGVKQEVSILFTDIANFSRVSESMHPDDLVNLLNRYFNTALKSIHDADGTVVDLIGDAIFAIWNAPVEQPDHRERACKAAIKLHEQLIHFGDAHHGLPLRTRAGLHTGTVCVGNIGSETRFDFTAIGDSTNLASRLEGLNKHLGTSVLATREIQRTVEDKLTSRLIGHFRFKGLGRAVEIHELLGSIEIGEKTRMWREKFADALQQFRQRKFDSAEAAFRETIRLRSEAEAHTVKPGDSGEDGPSLFYLEQIAGFRHTPPAYEWIGEVALKEK